jgi:hypothetical protein
MYFEEYINRKGITLFFHEHDSLTCSNIQKLMLQFRLYVPSVACINPLDSTLLYMFYREFVIVL